MGSVNTIGDLRNEELVLPTTFHVIVKFPSSHRGSCFPILFIDVAGESREHTTANMWARHNSGLRSDKAIAAELKVLGRLHDYHQVAWLGEAIRPIDRKQFLLSYLYARLLGTSLIESLRCLGWPPTNLPTVRSEFRALIRYLQFQLGGDLHDNPHYLSGDDLEAFREVCHAPLRRDLLSHLAAASARWASLFGNDIPMPSFPIRETNARSSTFHVDRTMDLEEIKEVVTLEANPVYKAIWILAAFGGPRTSEILHMWQCDVLPPASGELITGYPLSTPLVLIAHPSESRYTGDLTRLSQTRLQYIVTKYGLMPRNLVSGYRQVGWKHPLETDRSLRSSYVFWSDEKQANTFSEAIAEVRHFHSKHRTSERHPWLWVNLKAGSGFGSPVASSKLRKAFDRACKRAGLRPHVNGRRPHGLRHSYKLQLEIAGLDPSLIQIAMRHRSIESQDDYGRMTQELRRHLETWNQ